jgi:hypothetical protein
MKARKPVFVKALAVTMSLAALLASLPLLAAQIEGARQSANQPFIGLWKLNLDKSHRRAPATFTAYREFHDAGDGWIFETVTTLTPRGPRFLFTAARFDGKPYPDYTAEWLGNFVKNGTKPPQTVTFVRVNANQIRWTDTVNGRTVAEGTETVSADDSTLTMTNHVPGQGTTGVQVFDRVAATSPSK